MLVLTRKVDEVIMIGDEIAVQILNSRPGQIRLGISAPKKIPVHRREIYDLIQSRSEQKKLKAK